MLLQTWYAPDTAPVKSIEIFDAPDTARVGETVILRARATPDTDTVLDLTWAVSDDAVASVAPISGQVMSATLSGLSAGSVRVTATSADGREANLDMEITGDE